MPSPIKAIAVPMAEKSKIFFLLKPLWTNITPIITPAKPAKPTKEAETNAGSTDIPNSDLKT